MECKFEAGGAHMAAFSWLAKRKGQSAVNRFGNGGTEPAATSLAGG